MALLFAICFSAPLAYGANEKSEDFKQLEVQAKQGYADAQFELAKRYFFGGGIERSYQKNKVKNKVILNEIDAQNYRKAEERDYKVALEWFKAAAKQGHAEAQLILSRIYFSGRPASFPLDYNKGLKWLKVAAEQGYAEAQYQLAERYYYGEHSKNGERDWPTAVEWHEAAARQGHAKAQYKLGEMYEFGHGVKKDPQKAFEWFKAAVEQGHKEAQTSLRTTAEAAAKQGYVWAQFELGEIYYKGRGVTKDYKLAAEWFKAAAEQGHAEAQNRLDKIYSKVKGLKESFQNVEYWKRIRDSLIKQCY